MIAAPMLDALSAWAVHTFAFWLIAAFLSILSRLINQDLIDPIMKSMMWNRSLCECVRVNTLIHLDPGLPLI